MTVVIYAAAFSVPVADLADLVSFIVKRNPPYLLMSESEFFAWRRDVDGNQINYSV
jgi:hypothetical protein